MLGLDPAKVRATIQHLRLLQRRKAAGFPAYLVDDPSWLIAQAINRRGGWPDDPHARGTARPLPDGRYPPKASGMTYVHLEQLARRINTPRLRVYTSELGEWGPYLRKRLPHRFTEHWNDE